MIRPVAPSMESPAGKPVADWGPERGIEDPGGTVYRVSLSWEESEEGEQWTDRFAAFLEGPHAGEVTGLIVGSHFKKDGAGHNVVDEARVERFVRRFAELRG